MALALRLEKLAVQAAEEGSALRDEQFQEMVTRWETLPARPARYAPFPDWLDPRIAYIMANLAVFLFYWNQMRSEFNWLLHCVFPVLSTGVLLYAIYKSFPLSTPYDLAPIVNGAGESRQNAPPCRDARLRGAPDGPEVARPWDRGGAFR